LTNLRSSKQSIEFVHADIRDRDAIRPALEGCDVLFHLAAQSNVIDAERDPETAFQSNVTGTRRLLDTARELGVKRVVFSSSREVYGDPVALPVRELHPRRPKNVYGRSKLAGEELCTERTSSHFRIVTVRLANVYGPRARTGVIPRFLRRARANEPLTLFGGSQVLDFLWVAVAVDGLMVAGFAQNVPAFFNAGSGQGTSISELAGRIIELSGSRSRILSRPPRPVDVTSFVADTTTFTGLLNCGVLENSLERLPDMIRLEDAGEGDVPEAQLAGG